MTFLLVCGHSNIDVQIQVDELPAAGKSHPIQDRRTVWGGTAANIARHAAGLEVPTRLWSRVGDDFPPDWRAALEASGVDLAFDTEAGGRTPTCYIFTNRAATQSYAMDQGAMGHMAEHPPAPELLPAEGWLHLCTGQPDAYMALATAARNQGVRVAFDPGQEIHFAYDAASFERLLDLADVLFLNEVELQAAYAFLRYGDPVQFLDHVDAVVVTRGSGGASLYRSGKDPVHHRPPAVTVIDPTGAGDAFRAAWYAALHAGESMGEALRWGVAGGAFAVQHEGPQNVVLDRPSLEALRV